MEVDGGFPLFYFLLAPRVSQEKNETALVRRDACACAPLVGLSSLHVALARQLSSGLGAKCTGPW